VKLFKSYCQDEIILAQRTLTARSDGCALAGVLNPQRWSLCCGKTGLSIVYVIVPHPGEKPQLLWGLAESGVLKSGIRIWLAFTSYIKEKSMSERPL